MVRSLRARPHNSPLEIRSIDAPAASAGKVAGKDSVLVIIDDASRALSAVMLERLNQHGVVVETMPPVNMHAQHFGEAALQLKPMCYRPIPSGNRKQRRAQQRGR